jgi:large subunit ribosomal protein L15
MQLHQLKRKNPNEKHVQIGRGGKRGKTSGRGTKGQNARAGNKKWPELRTIIKRLPKLRGYRFHSFQDKAAVVNVGALETAFAKNDKVTPESLKAKKLVSYPKGSKPVVKILATGEITIPLLVSGCKVSKQAQDKIVAAGGAVK